MTAPKNHQTPSAHPGFFISIFLTFFCCRCRLCVGLVRLDTTALEMHMTITATAAKKKTAPRELIDGQVVQTTFEMIEGLTGIRLSDRQFMACALRWRERRDGERGDSTLSLELDIDTLAAEADRMACVMRGGEMETKTPTTAELMNSFCYELLASLNDPERENQVAINLIEGACAQIHEEKCEEREKTLKG